MKIKFKGRVLHPTAFALARNMGLDLMRGWNDVDSAKARKLLKIHPEAFETEKPKPQFLSKKKTSPLSKETEENKERE